MKDARLNRLFNPVTRRCFDVAVDHDFFNEAEFLPGIEYMAAVITGLSDARPDAIQLSIGQAPLLQGLRLRFKPALVLRTDVANVYGRKLPRSLSSVLIAEPVEQALRVDAACVVVNLFRIEDESEISQQCIVNICALKSQCDRYGMPLMVEPLVFRANSAEGGYMVNGDVSKIVPLVRQAVELGADIIKADPTDDVSQYHKVIQTAGRVPVLVRGGSRASEREILNRTAALLQQGAAGIVYGRNIVQHPYPAKITRALMAVVHDGASPDEAAKFLDPVAA